MKMKQKSGKDTIYMKDIDPLKMLVELVTHRANEKDEEINNRLLKKLVMNYALAEKNLVELNQIKNKFLGIAAHDLRNPLGSIMGFSEILLDQEVGPLNDDQRECLSIISYAASNMLNLVNELLDVAVIESGKLDLHFTPGSLKDLLEQRVKLNTMVAQKKNIRLHAEFGELPEVVFDENRVGQVVDNLISNAIKFSPFDTNIHISLVQEASAARVVVRDEGPGISEEDQMKLFGEFQKLSARPTGEEKSTGLGLAIVKKIVEAHHGAIEVKSKLGEGSAFSFTLPLKGSRELNGFKKSNLNRT
jgi:two-component system, sensor histidine kinase and response regulator